MNTRCRPGDLAVITGGEPENIGIILRVLACEMNEDFGWCWSYEDASRPVMMWDHDTDCEESSGAWRATAEDPDGWAQVIDSDLHPIRDQPGADETLSWAGLPVDATLKPKPQREFSR